MSIVRRLTAMEILDSRGRPTIKATYQLGSGAIASASVPSGASTGTAEAIELRDNDPTRYAGLGCLAAVHNIEGPIDDALEGRQFLTQQALDDALIELDGTTDKSRLGANAVLAVSLSFGRAVALERVIPLYQHFADILDPDGQITHLPRPTINLFSGGKHAGGQVEVQDVLVVVPNAETVDRTLSTTFSIYQSAKALIKQKYGERPLVGDEGGLAPAFQTVEAMLSDAMAAVESVGINVGEEAALCIDVAASHFHSKAGYRLKGEVLDSRRMIDRVLDWVDGFQIVSVEDGLAEEDWAHWPQLTARIDGRALVVGDDLLATSPERINRAIEARAANALLLKVNQIGTLSEAAHSYRLARAAGWRVVISARSGETEDDWLSDLAVGWRADALKVGSITRSERLAKWNRLLEIERETGLPLNPWPNAQ